MKNIIKKPKIGKRRYGKESYPDVKRLVMGDNIKSIYEQFLENGMTPDEALSSAKRHYDVFVKSDPNNKYESFYAGLLPEVVVKPDYNKKYLVDLITHYPSKLWPIGHSELVTPGGNCISAGFGDDTYNLVLNNCSDATISALSQAFGTNQGWHLINTPGSAKEFAEKRLGGISYVEPDDDPYYNNATNTYIPATISLLLTLANFARKLSRTGQYADGKPSYNIQLNDDSMHNFHFDEEGNTVLDNGIVGTLTLPEVSIRPNLDVINAINRRIDRLASHTERTNYYNDAMKNPISGDVFYPHAGGLEPVYPEFDILSLGPLWKFGANVGYNYTKNGINAGYNYAKNAVNNLWNSPYGQYLRYPIGKLKYGLDAQFPTVYRKFKNSPLALPVLNGRVQLTNPDPRFMFVKTGQESPEITNFTIDLDVFPHGSGDWDSGYAVAFDGKHLLGKNVVSTEPMDLFTYGDKISLKPKDIHIVSGDAQELEDAARLGYNTISSPKLQLIYTKTRAPEKKGINLLKDDDSTYANAMKLLEREVFGSLRKKDFDFMNYVLRPLFEGKVYNYADLNKLATNELGELFGNAQARDQLLDERLWGDLVYDVSPNVESVFRKLLGIDLKKYASKWKHMYGWKNGKAPGIHIKPENRGKFTALKKRTGHSTSWFKKNGTPAQKKMATFALNAKKWNHKKS